MSYHSENGREFVGLRAQRNGRRQVVYDAITGERILVTIKDVRTSTKAIDAALREGISANKVLEGVLTALKKRNIRFELPR